MQYSDSLPAHNAESLLVHFRRVELPEKRATDFKSISLNPHQLCAPEMFFSRAYYPLDGCMCRDDYETVLDSTIRLMPADVHRNFSQKGLVKSNRCSGRRHAPSGGSGHVRRNRQRKERKHSSAAAYVPVHVFQRGYLQTCPVHAGGRGPLPPKQGVAEPHAWFESTMGPKGALLWAIMNTNYACTHMLVWDSGKAESRLNVLRDEFQAHIDWLNEQQANTGIIPIKERCMVLDEASKKFVSSGDSKLCANDHNGIVSLLPQGKGMPEWMSFPDVLDALSKIYNPPSMRGFCLFFTGLSAVGKSTMTKVFYAKKMELNDRPVTLLDGDIVRTNLSNELDFSKKQRNLNVTRIGFVASEIVKDGGIAVCARIALYPVPHGQVHEALEQYGGFVEVHVTPRLRSVSSEIGRESTPRRELV